MYRTYLPWGDSLPDTATFHDALRGLIAYCDESHTALLPQTSQQWLAVSTHETSGGEELGLVSIRQLPTYGRVTQADIDRLYGSPAGCR
jgi:hypothetical protein